MVAAWIIDRLERREDIEVELVDHRDYPMPYYEQERLWSGGRWEGAIGRA